MTKQYLSLPEFSMLFRHLSLNVSQLVQFLSQNGINQRNIIGKVNNFCLGLLAQLQKQISKIQQESLKIYKKISNYQILVCGYQEQVRLSKLNQETLQNKIICIEEQYTKACIYIQQKQLQIKKLKAFNSMDISFIPSIEVENHPQEQKQRDSTEIISHGGRQDSCQFGNYLMDISSDSASSMKYQHIQCYNSDQKQSKDLNQQKLAIKKQANIYDLLVQIQEEGFKQLQLQDHTRQKKTIKKILEAVNDELF